MRRFRKSFKVHTDSLKFLSDSISDDTIDSIIDFIENSKSLYLTGVGKNADLMYKISKTFNSLSIRCHFMDPIDAMHGDLGMLTPESSIIASSKSGTTWELIRFLSEVKKLNQNHKILLIHCNENLHYENEENQKNIFISVKYEADHLNIVPTVSLCAIEVFLHSIACEIIENRNFQKHDMLKNHPAGAIGRLCAK